MPKLSGSAHRGGLLLVCLTAGLCLSVSGQTAFAGDDASDPKPQTAVKKKRHRTAQKAAPKAAEATKTPTVQDVPPKTEAVDVAATTPETKTSGAIDFSAPFDRAGASACKGQMNALATSTMGSVEKFNTVANWSQTGGDKRAVSLAIGQRYAAGSAVPFGLSQVISAPNQRGSCDGFTVQVFPSPLSCAKLRDSIVAQRGQQIGDLAGIPLMQDAGGRTMLVPTASDTCVLVATRTFYAK